MIKAVIYDMDGVLIDSEPLWHEAEIATFATVGVKLTSQMCRQTTGLRIDEVVEYWHHKHPWTDVTQAQVEADIWDAVIHLVRTQGRELPGIRESIAVFQDKGYALALASSSSMRLIEVVLEKLKIKDVFTVIHSAENEKYGKPHPAVYLTTANMLNIAPTKCLAIEDSVNGVIAAKAAKMKCIAVPEKNTLKDKRYGIADVVVSSLYSIDDALFTQISS